MLKHFSLFTGIGGIDLAAEWAGFETVGQCEWADYPTKVLEKNWPHIPRWRDVKDVTAESLENRGIGGGITLLSGGFPCQPHSLAGKRQASNDERDLWSEFVRVICEIKPGWVLGENVSGLLSSESGRFFGRVLGDLAQLGYDAWWYCFPAYPVGAFYARERVAIIACSDCNRLQGVLQGPSEANEAYKFQGPPSKNMRNVISLWNGKGGNSDGIRDSNGVPNWMDRIKCLGNCVNPYQFYPILKLIADIENEVIKRKEK